MRDWHHHKRTDIGLRLSGAGLWGLAWFAVHALAALHLTHSRTEPTAWAFILAAAAFCCASLGAVLITQGHHIFDSVEIGERWRVNSLPGPGRVDTDNFAERDEERVMFRNGEFSQTHPLFVPITPNTDAYRQRTVSGAQLRAR